MSMDGGMLVVTVVAIAVGTSINGGMLVVTVVAIAVGNVNKWRHASGHSSYSCWREDLD